MTTPSQTKLLVRPGFLALFVTQLLSAFNDNFLKNAVVIWISATQAQLFGLSPEVMISLCSGVFILPFFLFSATAGQLADRYEKPRMCARSSSPRSAIMALAALGFLRAALHLLLAAIFLMGVHSAFLGPVKYSILPQLVAADELVAGNALVEMGTFLAILAGTIGGGCWCSSAHGPAMVAGLAIALGRCSATSRACAFRACPRSRPICAYRSTRSRRRSRSCASPGRRARCSCRCSASPGSGSSARCS